jgi:hypothetical protein
VFEGKFYASGSSHIATFPLGSPASLSSVVEIRDKGIGYKRAEGLRSDCAAFHVVVEWFVCFSRTESAIQREGLGDQSVDSRSRCDSISQRWRQGRKPYMHCATTDLDKVRTSSCEED